MPVPLAILAAGMAAALAPVGADAAAPAPVELPAAAALARWPAPEAKQGVAVDARYFYAISNNLIGKYDKQSGRRVAQWEGEKRLFRHMNSCVVDARMLVCAASNHPSVPMASSVEFFDTETLRHSRTVALPPLPGSLTWIERRGEDWFAGIANYDEGRGGTPGHDHRWTMLLKLDSQFRPTGSWLFPESLLARFAPMSNSGGSWGDDGLLYVTGHDRPELYALSLPQAGSVLEHVATIPLPTGGQAFSWDRSGRRVIWSIDRATRLVTSSRVPDVARQR
jgi:hypothetical protein